MAAAVELLAETGDERALTLRSIARRAGIAAPSIYAHFADQPAIMLAVVRGAFAELTLVLRTAAEQTDTPRARLEAISRAYLDYARTHPERYRTMFGGLWVPTLESGGSVTEEDLSTLGDECLGLLTSALAECAATGVSTSSDPAADAVALWLGLHGLAHQRASTRAFPWPDGIEDRLITSLGGLDR